MHGLTNPKMITIFIDYTSAVDIGEHKLRSRYDLVA